MVEWAQLTSDELKRVDRNWPVIIPLGLQEAHGSHLPNGTDSMTAEYVVQTAAKDLDCVVCPTVNYGYAGSSYGYAGTLGVKLETLAGVLVDLVGALMDQGFRKVIFLSGHGGNKPAYQLAVDRLAHQYPDARCAYHDWWTLAGFTDVHHADAFESETAAAMGIRFERDRAVDVQVQKTWYTEFFRAKRYPDTGAVNGKPSEADLERGKKEVADAVEALRQLIRRALEEA